MRQMVLLMAISEFPVRRKMPKLKTEVEGQKVGVLLTAFLAPQQ